MSNINKNDKDFNSNAKFEMLVNAQIQGRAFKKGEEISFGQIGKYTNMLLRNRSIKEIVIPENQKQAQNNSTSNPTNSTKKEA